MAHQVAGGEVLRPSAQEAVKPLHLTGSAGEQHLPGLQGDLDLPKGLPQGSQVALDVLGPPQAPQVLPAEAGDVPQVLVGVKGGAEDHAAPLQHILRDQGEHAAGGGVLADGVVLVPGGEHRRDAAALLGIQDGAHGGAAAAAHAAVRVHRRVGKALLVPPHGQGVFRAHGGAGGAAGAAGVVRQHGPRGDRRLHVGGRLLPGGTGHGGPEVIQGVLPGRLQPLSGGGPVDGVAGAGGGSGADDPVLEAQAAEEAEGPGALRRRQLRRGDGGEEGHLEL